MKELGDWRGQLLSRLRILVKEADPDVVQLILMWPRYIAVAPHSFDSTKVPDGTHAIVITLTDTSNNASLLAPWSITVSN